MFQKIEKLSDLLPHIEGSKQIRVKVDESTGFSIVCYMVQDEDTFEEGNMDFTQECRGIAFDQDGNIASRTLGKFFNVGERESTRPENIDWSQVDRIMDKRDGSMVTFLLLPDGTLKAKTKKTTTSAEALLADKILAETPNGVEWVKSMIKDGLTPTFEVTSPSFPIVLRYEKDELTLLQVRDTVTGEYWDLRDFHVMDHLDWAFHGFVCPFPVVQNLKDQFLGDDGVVSWPLLKEAAEKTEGVEGWIIQFKDGNMVKLKTVWYVKLHHSVVFTRWRDIARSVCADQSDDLKGAFALVGRSIEPILQVERKVNAYIITTKNAVELHAYNGIALNRTPKDMALALREHPLFSLIMREFRGANVDYMEHYVKHQLELDWSLDVVI